MPKIRITQKCRFTDQNGDTKVFEPGVHEVDESTAEHWFIKAHSEPEEEPAAEAGKKPAEAAPAAAKKAGGKAGKK